MVPPPLAPVSLPPPPLPPPPPPWPPPFPPGGHALALPANVSAELSPVPADQAEVKGQLKTDGKTAPGSYRVQVVAVGTHQGKTFSAVASVPLTVVK